MRNEHMVSAPARHLCPSCLSMAESFAGYVASERDYELEDRLYQGTATMPEKIKATWKSHGNRINFDDPYLHIPTDLFVRAYAPHYEEGVPSTIAYETLRFDREVTKNKGFTVTRISCQGITVEETIAYAQ